MSDADMSPWSGFQSSPRLRMLRSGGLELQLIVAVILAITVVIVVIAITIVVTVIMI